MDINNFKSINDTNDYVVGDKVLKTLSNILSEVFKDYVISRYFRSIYDLFRGIIRWSSVI